MEPKAKTVNLKKLKPYGDIMDDGTIQLAFTLPVEPSPEARPRLPGDIAPVASCGRITQSQWRDRGRFARPSLLPRPRVGHPGTCYVAVDIPPRGRRCQSRSGELRGFALSERISFGHGAAIVLANVRRWKPVPVGPRANRVARSP